MITFKQIENMHPIGGMFQVGDLWIPNFMTYAGVAKIAHVLAGDITVKGWKVGCLAGPVTKEDTLLSHAWQEPDASSGYARQSCTVSEIVPTSESGQPITVMRLTPVTFECLESNEPWEISCSRLFCTMTDSNDAEELISISSVLPSAVRLLQGNSFQTAYHLRFRA